MPERNRPRIFPISVPSIPEGMMAVRFHGKLAFIPARKEGESLEGRSPFTKLQIEALQELVGEVAALKSVQRQRRPDSLYY